MQSLNSIYVAARTTCIWLLRSAKKTLGSAAEPELLCEASHIPQPQSCPSAATSSFSLSKPVLKKQLLQMAPLYLFVMHHFGKRTASLLDTSKSQLSIKKKKTLFFLTCFQPREHNFKSLVIQQTSHPCG